MALGTLLTSVLGTMLAATTLFAAPSGTYAPPLPPRTNKKLLAGERLWSSKKILGRGGKTCAACHDSRRGPKLSELSLQRKVEDLPKLVYFELVSRSKNQRVEPDGLEVRALVAHIQNRFELDPNWNPADHPQAEVGVIEAQNFYFKGEYHKAIPLLESSLRLPISPQLAGEARILLGSIFQILGRETEAMEQFAEVLREFPEARIDPEIYSPKTIELFETVRRIAGLGQGR